MGTDPVEPLALTRSQTLWPRQLDDRLKSAALSGLWAIGSPEILAERKVGLLCSVRCPDAVALDAYATVRKLRDDGVTVISGFHSPVEKECLRILLEGKQPIIVCPARTIGKMRIPSDWRPLLEDGRLLILSRFERSPRRADTSSARRRNELVAALSDEVLIIHAEAGGNTERISELVDRWRIPRAALNSET
jgi:predicted Rossmann fold nucleotide-binding protein DprA/Smf involved in DNA uptake